MNKWRPRGPSRAHSYFFKICQNSRASDKMIKILIYSKSHNRKLYTHDNVKKNGLTLFIYVQRVIFLLVFVRIYFMCVLYSWVPASSRASASSRTIKIMRALSCAYDAFGMYTYICVMVFVSVRIWIILTRLVYFWNSAAKRCFSSIKFNHRKGVSVYDALCWLPKS